MYGKDTRAQVFKETDGPDDKVIVEIYMPNRVIEHYIRSYRVGFNDLISSVGGSLGLFLGFSLLSTLLSTYTYVAKKLDTFHKFKDEREDRKAKRKCKRFFWAWEYRAWYRNLKSEKSEDLISNKNQLA